MNLSKIPVRPYAEGIICVASTTEPETGKVKFEGRMEILSRHHQAREQGMIEIPRLAKHAMSDKLMEKSPNKEAGKLVEVPIRMFFGKAANALSVAYQAYDIEGHPVCKGDGESALRLLSNGENVLVEASAPCTGPDTCEFANAGGARCRRKVCLTVQIPGQDNALSTFEVRSSSYNTYRTLKGQLELVEKRFGGLRHVPLKLQLWQTSNQASEFASFDVFKIALDAASDVEAMKVAKREREDEIQAGLASDIDDAYSPLNLDTGEDDFDLVADFYKPRIASPRRRVGVASVVDQLTGAKSTMAGSSLAANVIAQALSRAGEAVALEQAQSSEPNLTA